jgi:hypothetical protein
MPVSPRAYTFRKCLGGEVFDMHCLQETVAHVPHITATEAKATYIH